MVGTGTNASFTSFMRTEQVYKSQPKSLRSICSMVEMHDFRPKPPLPSLAHVTKWTLMTFKTDLVCNLSDAWEMARQNICQSQKKQKQQYDRKVKLKKYRVGDRVFVHMPGDVRGKVWKFAKPFHGPYLS